MGGVLRQLDYILKRRKVQLLGLLSIETKKQAFLGHFRGILYVNFGGFEAFLA
jgi:hypothetical protein